MHHKTDTQEADLLIWERTILKALLNKKGTTVNLLTECTGKLVSTISSLPHLHNRVNGMLGQTHDPDTPA